MYENNETEHNWCWALGNWRKLMNIGREYSEKDNGQKKELDRKTQYS